MLRSLLMGVLALSTASACKGSGDAPSVQPGVSVGNVVEASGDVSATRGNEKRALAVGQEISGDDTIETGAEANVRIVFTHNNATWELGPNKKQLVSESLAWKAPKASTPADEVNEATLAAGRHAERETVTTGTTAPGAPAEEAPPAEAPSGGAPQAKEIAAEDGKKQAPKASRREAAEKTMMDDTPSKAAAPPRKTGSREPAPLFDSAPPPPPPPPPPPAPPSAPTTSPTITRESSTADASAEVRATIDKQRAELVTCLDVSSISIRVVVAKGKATFVFPAKTSDKAMSCFTAIAAKLSFPPDYNVTTTLDLTK